MTLEVLIEDIRWRALDLGTLAPNTFDATVDHLGLRPELCEASLLACDDNHICKLNTDFRDKPQPTNVLSWPAEERGAVEPGQTPGLPMAGPDNVIELGDIAISYDTSMKEALDAGIDPEAHVTHLIVHATLHLLGYDHIYDADGDLMEATEVEILGKLGHDDPYREKQQTELH